MFDAIARMTTTEVNAYARNLSKQNGALAGELASLKRRPLVRVALWLERVFSGTGGGE